MSVKRSNGETTSRITCGSDGGPVDSADGIDVTVNGGQIGLER